MSADPIFLDRTGRRHRLVVILSTGGGLLLVLAVLALVAGFTGTGPGALPGWPAGNTSSSAAARPKPSPQTTRSAADGELQATTPATTPPPATRRPTSGATAVPAPTATATPSRPGHRPTANPRSTTSTKRP